MDCAFFLFTGTPVRNEKFFNEEGRYRSSEAGMFRTALLQLAPRRGPVATPVLGRRCFGILDKIQDFTTKQMEKSREADTEKMIEYMSESKLWTLKRWRDTFESQLSGWKMYIPGASSSPGIKELKEFKALLDSFKEEELNDITLVTGAVKARVATQAGKPIDEVNKLIFFFRQSLIIANWLKLKKDNNETLPKTMLELQAMQEKDPRLRNVAKEAMEKKYKRSGRGRRSPV